MFCALIRYVKFLKRQANALECMNVTLKMAALGAETCRWLLCNKLTFICPIAFVGPFKNFM
jgi:hypothetical protein